jgi:hypothetical protein
MRRIISLAVVALAFSAGTLLHAQVRIPGAIHSNESCCAIGMRGPSVPANSHRLVVSVTGNQGTRGFRHHNGVRHDGHRDRFRNNVGGLGFGGGYLYNPYGYYDTQTMDDSQPAVNNYEQPADDEGPGLTVFERRRDYQLIGDSPEYQRQQQAKRADDARADGKIVAKNDGESSTAAAPAAPPEEVISTMLIFRDGSHREIRNYALMGSSIYDLSVKPGQGKMKIQIADLDIPATIAANDQRGIEFKLPKEVTTTQ